MGTNIWTGMTATAKRHMKAICSGEVTKTNVIGLRKIINAQLRKDERLSTSLTAPKVTREEVRDLQEALDRKQPKVTGELHDSGLKLLRSPRYRKRMEPVREVIENLDCFRLVGFWPVDDLHVTPLYRAIAKDGSKFTFYNIPWQSGGDGPQFMLGGFSGPTR